MPAKGSHRVLVAQVPAAAHAADTPLSTARCALVTALRDQIYLTSYDFEILIASQPTIELQRKLTHALIAHGLIRPSNANR